MTTIEKPEMLSKEDLCELALMAWNNIENCVGDKDAYAKLEAHLIPMLSGRIRLAIIASTVLSPDDIPQLAHETLIKALKRFSLHVETQRKKAREAGRFPIPPDFKEFSEKNVLATVHARLAQLVQQGNGKAYPELTTLLQPALINYILRESGRSGDYARELADQTWGRWLEAIKSKSGLFDPAGRQTFLQYLKNRARTLLRHDGAEVNDKHDADDDDNGQGVIETIMPAPTRAAEQTLILPELLRLFFRCGAKPHQVLTTALVKLLDYRPKEDIVPRFGDKSLSWLAVEFQKQYFTEIKPYCISEESFWHHCEYDRFKDSLQRPIGETYVEASYSEIRGNHATAGDVQLSAFFSSNQGPEKDIHDWSDKVHKQVRERLLRMDDFFWLFRCGDKPHKVLPTGFIEFLKYDASRSAADLSGLILAAIWQRFRRESFPVFAARELAGGWPANSRDKVLELKELGRPAREIYPEQEYEPLRPRYGRGQTGNIPLHAFYPEGEKPERLLHRWSQTIRGIMKRAIKINALVRADRLPHLALLLGFKKFLKYTLQDPDDLVASGKNPSTLLPLTLGRLAARFKKEFYPLHIEHAYWKTEEEFWEYCRFHILTNRLDEPVERIYQEAGFEAVRQNHCRVGDILLKHLIHDHEEEWKNIFGDQKNKRE